MTPLGDVLSQVKEVNGVKVLATKVADVDMNGLRNLGDQLKDKIGEGVVVIASVMDGKVKQWQLQQMRHRRRVLMQAT